MARLQLGRREFIRRAGSMVLVASCQAAQSGSTAQGVLPNPVGYASIGWPESQFPHALEMISRLGFRGVQILGWARDAYAGTKTDALRTRLQELNLKPVALSCSTLGLHPESPLPSEVSELRSYADFFRRLGGAYLQVTDIGTPGGNYSPPVIRDFGLRINALGKLAQVFETTLGYHPHFGTYGETREGLGRVLDATDPRYVKLIADIAHLTLGGSDPAEVLRTYRERLIVVHFKDVRRDIFALASQNKEQAHRSKHHFCEIGDGVVNFASVIHAVRKIDYRGWIVIELDTGDEGAWGPDAAAEKNRQRAHRLGLSV